MPILVSIPDFEKRLRSSFTTSRYRSLSQAYCIRSGEAARNMFFATMLLNRNF